MGQLQRDKFVTDVLSKGSKKCAAVCILPPPSARADGGGGGGGGGGGASSSSVPPPKPATPLAIKVPTWREVDAKKAAMQGKPLQLDFFARKRAAAAGGGGSPAGGAVGSGGGGTPAATPTTAVVAAAPSSANGAAAGNDEADDEFTQIGGLHRRLDLRVVPKACFAFATLYFTGSDHLNKRMRLKANELGYRLSEYALVPIGPDGKETGGPAVQKESEQAIFEFLKMDFLPPGPARNVEG